MRTTNPFTVACIAAAALALGACGAGETRDDDGAIVEGGNTDVFSLAVGDCFNDEQADATELESVPTVPCSEPHDNEVYAEYTFPAGDYPGLEAVQATAADECIAAFDAFVEYPYLDSALYIFPLYPTEDGWNEIDDRLVTCAIYDPEQQVTGTLAGAGR